MDICLTDTYDVLKLSKCCTFAIDFYSLTDTYDVLK